MTRFPTLADCLTLAHLALAATCAVAVAIYASTDAPAPVTMRAAGVGLCAVGCFFACGRML